MEKRRKIKELKEKYIRREDKENLHSKHA